jgi:hypothetical protein
MLGLTHDYDEDHIRVFCVTDGNFGGSSMGYQFVIGLVTGVRYPACDVSVCYFPKRSEVRGAYLISHRGFFKYFNFMISLPFDVT